VIWPACAISKTALAASHGCFRRLTLMYILRMQHVTRLQVTRGGLRRLLALPALVELQVHIFTDNLDDIDAEDGESYHEISYERNEELTAMLDELKALFAQHGRRLTSGPTR
jgi:hypothetical protein